MRHVRSFLTFVKGGLQDPFFWIFLILIALVGPLFVVLHAQTDRAIRELRPLLSEPATVAHFNTRAQGNFPAAYTPAMQFRTPASESAPEAALSSAFKLGWQLQSVQVQYSSDPMKSLSSSGSLADVYRILFPGMMILAGVLAVPSRRRWVSLRIVAPCGRADCFVRIAGTLGLQIAALVLVSAATTWLALAVLRGVTIELTVFVARYFSAVLLYGMGFGLLGLAIGEIVRHRGVALVIALALIFGAWTTLSPLPSKLFGVVVQSATKLSIHDPLQHPVVLTLWPFLNTPQTTFISVGIILEKLATPGEDPSASRAALGRSLLRHWAWLACFALFWLFIAWIACPRSVRMPS